jgi:hypothetical protein
MKKKNEKTLWQRFSKRMSVWGLLSDKKGRKKCRADARQILWFVLKQELNSL